MRFSTVLAFVLAAVAASPAFALPVLKRDDDLSWLFNARVEHHERAVDTPFFMRSVIGDGKGTPPFVVDGIIAHPHPSGSPVPSGKATLHRRAGPVATKGPGPAKGPSPPMKGPVKAPADGLTSHPENGPTQGPSSKGIDKGAAKIPSSSAKTPSDDASQVSTMASQSCNIAAVFLKYNRRAHRFISYPPPPPPAEIFISNSNSQSQDQSQAQQQAQQQKQAQQQAQQQAANAAASAAPSSAPAQKREVVALLMRALVDELEAREHIST
ncbi:hypothetical protein EUX98_g3311 [Antrodiella citrinella]|uniref:Uncharacterized protein n=1 Tax=Antrodiella citrinella TaxID=2447956 RepID=A0A4S4MWU1_9APHY|nr:hypothetical protein EUX98_g3311 [Antrodiella citrinella]